MSLVHELLLENLDIGPQHSSKGVTLVPLRLKDGAHAMSLSTAIEQEFVEILESESVNHLKIKVTSPPVPILLPFLQVVGGGKQDRMLTRPLIIEPIEGEKIWDIPVNCVEQGRWTYSRASTGEQTSTKFTSHKKARMSPSMGSVNVSADQSTTWGSISWYQEKSNVARAVSPSQSFMEIEEEVHRRQEEPDPDLEDLVKFVQAGGSLMADQSGLALFMGEEMIGLELYGSPSLWSEIAEAVTSSFVSELGLRERKEESTSSEHVQQTIRDTIGKRQYKEVSSDQFGEFYMDKGQDEFSSLVINYKGKPAEVYLAHRRSDITGAMSQGFDMANVQQVQQVQQFANVDLPEEMAYDDNYQQSIDEREEDEGDPVD